MATIDRYNVELRVTIKQFKTDIDQATKMYTGMYADFLAITKKGESDIAAERAKFGKQFVQSTEKSVKAQTDAAKKGGDTRKKVEQEVSRETQQAFKAVENAQKNLSKLQVAESQASGAKRRELTGKRIKAEIDLEEKKFKRTEVLLKQEIAAASGNAKKQMKLQGRVSDARAASQKRIVRFNTQLVNSQKRVNAGSVEMAENFATLSKSLQAGDVAGVFGLLGGVKGGLIGTAIDGIKGIGGALLEAAEAAMDFEDRALKIQTLLSDTQAQALPTALAGLRNIAKETGAPLGVLEESLFNVVSAIPKLANNLQAAAQVSAKAAKAAIALGADTNSVTLATTNLGNALSLNLAEAEKQTLIMDVLAQTFKLGVVPSGEAMAGAIAKAAPIMGTLTTNAEEALTTIGAMSAVLTASGVSIDESQTKINALAIAILKGNNAQKLMNLGIEGFDPKTKKIEDWSKVIQGMGENTEEVLKILTRKEAKVGFLLLAKEGGKAFAEMSEQMKNSGGTARKMFDTMAKSGKQGIARLDAAWNDAMITIGTSVEHLLNTGRDTLAGAINWVSDFFKSAEEEFAETEQRFQTLSASAASLRDALPDLEAGLSAGDTPAALNAINSQLESIRAISPDAAESIQLILDSPAGQTEEGLLRIKDTIESIEELGRLLALQEAAKLQADRFELLADRIAETATEAKLVTFGGADSIKEINAELAKADQLLEKGATFTKEQRKELAGQISGLANQAQFLADGVLTEQARTDLIQRRIDLGRQSLQASLAERVIAGDIEASARKHLETTIQLAEGNGRALDLQLEKEQILASVREQVGEFAVAGAEAELDLFIEQVQAKEEVADAQADGNALSEEGNELAEDSVGLSEDEIKLLESQGVLEKQSNRDKITALKASQAKMINMVTVLKAQLAVAKASNETEKQHALLILQSVKAKQAEAQAAADAAAGKAPGKALTAADITISEGKGIADLEAEIAVLEGAIGKAGTAIGKLEGSATKSTKGTNKAAKDQEKATKELAKKMKDYRDAIAKAEEDYNKALEDIRQKRLDQESKGRIDDFKAQRADEQAARDRLKAEKDLIKNIGKFAQDMKDLADGFAEAQVGTITQVLADLLPEVDRLAQSAKDLAERQAKAVENVGERIAADENALAETTKSLDAVTTARDDAGTSARSLTAEIKQLESALSGLREDLPEAQQREAGVAALAAKGAGRREPEVSDPTREELQDLRRRLQLTSKQGAASRELSDILEGTTFSNYEEAVDLVDGLIDQLAIVESKQDSINVLGESSSSIQTDITNKERELGELRTKQEVFNKERERNATEVVRLTDKQIKLAEQIKLAKAAELELSDSDIAILAQNIVKLREIFDQQEKIRAIERERSQTTDPERIAALDRQLDFEKQFAIALQSELGLAGDILEKTIETVEAQGASIEGVTELVAGLREVDATLESSAVAYRKQAEFAKNVVDLQSKLSDDLEKNHVTHMAIAAELRKEEAFTKALINLKKAELDDTSLTREEHARINAELVEQEKRLRDIGVQQNENARAVIETREAFDAEQIETVLDGFRELGQYIDGDFASAIEGATKGLTALFDPKADHADKIKAALGIAEALGAALLNAGDFIDDIAQKVSETGAGAAVEAVGDVTTKIGKALLNAPPPLSIAGAAILAAGLIAKFIGKIAQAIHGQQQSEADLAEERLASEQALIDLQNKRLEGMQKLIDLGDRSLDQASEQLAMQKEILAERLRESGLAADLAEMSDQKLQAEIDAAEVRRSDAESSVKEAERLLEDGSRSQRKAFLEEMGFDVRRGSSKKQLREFLEGEKADLADANALLENGNDILDQRLAILELEKQIMEEQIGVIQLRIRLEGESVEALEAIADLARDALQSGLETLDLGFLQKAFEAAGIGSGSILKGQIGPALSALTDDELADLLLAMTKIGDTELSPEIDDLAGSWLNATDGVDAYAESLANAGDSADDLFNKQKRLLEQQRDLNEITETEFQEQTLALLDAEIERLNSIKDSFATVLDFNLAINDLELEKLRLLGQQNAELMESDPIMTGLIRRRQQLLALIREEGGIGATSAARQAELAQIKADIIARMVEQGATPAQIQEMIDSLPKFHAGGEITGATVRQSPANRPGGAANEALIVAKRGEFVVDAERALAIGPQNIPAALDMLASPEARQVAAGIMRKDMALLNFSQIVTLGGVIVNNQNDFRGSDPARGAQVMTEQLKDIMIRTVNRGIKAGEVSGDLQK